MEDQLSALGLALNATVLWNSMYIDNAVAQRRAAGRAIPDKLLAGLSPLISEHINFHGRYPFTRPELDDFQPLRDPTRPQRTTSCEPPASATGGAAAAGGRGEAAPETLSLNSFKRAESRVSLNPGIASRSSA